MQQCEFDLNGLVLRGQRHGQPGATPFFALHGWLDNSASFDLLLPRLTGMDVVALDLPGQGRSGWRAGSGAYAIWQDLFELLLVAEQLGWSSFGLIGHSRGAAIATLLASSFPEKVSHLAVIEGLTPQFVDAGDVSAQLYSSITAAISLHHKPRRRHYYDCFERAVKARERGVVALNTADATILARRGVALDEKGYYWDNDPRLLLPSEIKFSLAQAKALVAAIPLNINLIIGEHGLIVDKPESYRCFSEYNNVTIHSVDGYHHLHMSTCCNEVAATLNSVLSL